MEKKAKNNFFYDDDDYKDFPHDFSIKKESDFPDEDNDDIFIKQESDKAIEEIDDREPIHYARLQEGKEKMKLMKKYIKSDISQVSDRED